MHFADHVNAWVARELTGCFFAAKLANKQSIVWAEVESSSFGPGIAETIATTIDATAANNTVAGHVFPDHCDVGGIVALLRELSSSARWRIKRITTDFEPLSCVSLAIWFRCQAGHWTSVVGFAPIHSMPVTRRAPFTALTAWGGPKREGYLGAKRDVTGITDASLSAFADQSTPALEAIHSNTLSGARPLLKLTVPPVPNDKTKDPDFERAKKLFTLTFCLPKSSIEEDGALVGLLSEDPR